MRCDCIFLHVFIFERCDVCLVDGLVARREHSQRRVGRSRHQGPGVSWLSHEARGAGEELEASLLRAEGRVSLLLH